jgi:enoyl-CoA hydratase/carnithine racemase
LLITSAKKAFIVGADITEFIAWFGMPEEVAKKINSNVKPEDIKEFWS